MKNILSGWTIFRAVYILMGVAMFIQGLKQMQWIVMLLGLYFVVMAVLGVGCMGSQCAAPLRKTTASNTDVNFEELK